MSAPLPTAAAAPLMTAAKRLAQSRQRLLQAMRGTSAAPGAAKEQHAAGSATIWLDILKLNPAARIVIDTVSAWWAHHPLHVAGMAAAATVKTVVQPVAIRHPLALVMGALMLGSLLAWSRPWRWALKPALFAGLLPQLVSQALSQAPIQSWLATFVAPSAVPPGPSAADSD